MDGSLNKNFNVILFHENQRIGDILASSIEAYTNQSCMSFSSLNAGINSLKNSSSLDVVITTNRLEHEKVLDKIIKIFDSGNEEKTLICIDEVKFKEYYPNVTFLKSENKVKEVIRVIAAKKGVTAKMMANLNVGAYYPIKKNLLIPGMDLAVDLFSYYNNHYIQIFSKGQRISKDAMTLINNTYSDLFVRSFERLDLISKVCERIQFILDSEKMSGVERVGVTKTAYNMVQEWGQDLGINESTLELAHATIDSMKKMVKKSNTLSRLLNILLSNEESYKYQHSMITLYIGAKIIEDVEWKSDELLVKLGYVTMFADITLSDKLSRIQTKYQLENSNLTTEEKELIRHHALKSARLISRLKRVPIGVESLIKHHHGARDGIGLSMTTYNIAPVGLIFMIASEFASNIINSKERGYKLNKDRFFVYLNEKYGRNPKFKDYLWSFDQIKI